MDGLPIILIGGVILNLKPKPFVAVLLVPPVLELVIFQLAGLMELVIVMILALKAVVKEPQLEVVPGVMEYVAEDIVVAPIAIILGGGMFVWPPVVAGYPNRAVVLPLPPVPMEPVKLNVETLLPALWLVSPPLVLPREQLVEQFLTDVG